MRMNFKEVKKGNMALYVAMLILCIFLMIMLKNCEGEEQPLDDEDTIIDVAIEYSPMYCYGYADTLGGFQYDLLRLAMEMGGKTVRIHRISQLERSLTDMKDGVYDIVIAQFPMTKTNKELWLFSEPTMVDRQVLVQRKGEDGETRLKSQLDLAGDTVHVMHASPMVERIENLSNEIGEPIFIVEERFSAEQLVGKVSRGEIANAVVNEQVALALAEKYENIDVSTPISMSQFQAWTMAKENSELCDSVNSWLSRAKLTDAYRTLCERYRISND